MALIVDLASLKSNIAAFAHRSDLSDVMDVFIKSAETRINRNLRVSLMEKRSTTSAEDSFIDLPTDFLELRNLQLGDRVPVGMNTLQQLDLKRNSDELQMAITGNQLEIRPTISSDDPIDVEINYYAKVISVLSGTPDYTLLIEYPMLYLYACMIEVALFIQDDNRVDMWVEAFKVEMNESNNFESQRLFQGAPLEIRGY